MAITVIFRFSRATRRPAMGDITAVPRANGVTSNPACSGVYPSPSCRKTDTTSSTPVNPVK